LIIEKNLRTIIVVGTRPNFIKIAPLLREINKQNDRGTAGGVRIDYSLVHTGQHYDPEMSDLFFRELNIPKPRINLKASTVSPAIETAELMIGFEKICLQERPGRVVVVGDVTSTLACTLVASKLAIKVAHIESGLRSFDRSMPEEINRSITDSLCDLLFTPSEDADRNLLREGIPRCRIRRVGNIMIDALLINLDKARKLKPYRRYGAKEKEYVFVTLHRPLNVDNKKTLKSIIHHLVDLSQKMPVLFPVHPRTEKNLIQFGLLPDLNKHPSLKLFKPIGYLASIGLIDKARFVLTDSGGLQEETTFLKVPCLTLRPNTERPITIRLGTNKLTSLESLNDDVRRILEGTQRSGEIPKLWDGRTSERIVKILKREA